MRVAQCPLLLRLAHLLRRRLAATLGATGLRHLTASARGGTLARTTTLSGLLRLACASLLLRR